MSEITSPPVRYTGSKWRIAPWVISHFPKHVLYCEPFCGGANVLFRKQPSEIEVINDLDGDIVNFFDVLRGRTDEFLRAITLTPFSRFELKRAHEPHEDSLERARRFYVRCWQKFTGGAQGHEGAWRFEKPYNKTQKPLKEWLKQDRVILAAQRLRAVHIECDTAVNVIKRHDNDQSFFYCDPPYVLGECTENPYLHGMSDDEHIALSDVLHSARGMVIISGYDNSLYQKLYGNWKKVSIQAYTSQSIARRESLWISPLAQKNHAQRQLF